ncbi:MAG: AMP-binding protein [Microbacteriaceae bacterium]|nr:AMP-binding protein [Microbacteriaceae bacterium]MCI1207023.1 AMP-binding protein [Microbacteriaceae bacterium]
MPDTQVSAASPDIAAPDLLGATRILAATHPRGEAIVDLSTGRVLTWADCDAEADALANRLRAWGIVPGDRVAIQLPNWAEFFLLSLATLRLGALIVPILPALSVRDTLRVLRLSGSRVLATPETFHGHSVAAPLAEALRQGLDPVALEHLLIVRGSTPIPGGPGWETHAWPRDLAAEPASPALDERTLDPDRLAQIVFTSGSTGAPKGVLHGLRELSRVTDLLVEHLRLTPADRILAVSPTAHQTGFICNLLLSWRLGAPAILLDLWDPRRAILEGIHRYGATYAQGATTFLIDLTEAYRTDPMLPSPDSLRLFVTIGAAAAPAQLARAAEVLGARMLAAYGSSEICLGSVSSPDDPEELAWASSGRAMPGVQLRVVDADGREAPAMTDGALLVHSPTMFRGYLGAEPGPGPGGWFRTGDLAHLDAHGLLHLTGREHDLVNRGGEKIPVDAVEATLAGHPDLLAAVIVPEPDPRLGERGCLFAVPRTGQTLPDLPGVQAWLERAGVTRLHWPEDLVPLDELPRTATGKVDRLELRRRAAERSRWGDTHVG